MKKRSYDVAVLGGGLAGLCAALQIKRARPQTTVVVLEKGRHPAPEGAFKVGESTVECSAHYFTEVLGLKEHIKSDQLPKLGLRCFFHNTRSANLEDRLEFGSNSFVARSTYQLDRGRLENFLGERIQEEGVEFVEDASVRAVELGEENALHTISFDQEGESTALSARWIVDASGRASLLKRKLGLQEECGHQINSAWFRIPQEINIDDWGSTPEWRRENSGRTSRWFSTNHLMGEGYWVWIIPLSSGSTSFGIVADPRYHPLSEINTVEKAFNWFERFEPHCHEHIKEFKERLQDFHVLKGFSRGAKKVFSADRWALTGDSGIFIDPLYSPGSDFIGYANTWITDLVTRDLDGGKIAGLSEVYDALYRGFAENSFLVYEDQYHLFGNPTVMPLKIIWDFATYWSFFAFLFTHNKLTELKLYQTVEKELRSVERLNREMQHFFRELHQVSHGDVPRAFLDISKTFLWDLNKRLVAPFCDEEFEAQLRRNLQELTELGAEIVERARENFSQLARPSSLTGIEVHSRRLDGVYPLLSPLEVVGRESSREVPVSLSSEAAL